MEADFAAVWSRVTGSAQAETPEGRLRSFLQQEAETACAVRAAAGLSRDEAIRSQLCSLYGEKQRQVKRLRAALFLYTGVSECPAGSCCQNGCRLTDALRTLYARTMQLSGDYREAAESCGHADLKALYASLSEAELRHSQCLLSIAERLI